MRRFEQVSRDSRELEAKHMTRVGFQFSVAKFIVISRYLVVLF